MGAYKDYVEKIKAQENESFKPKEPIDTEAMYWYERGYKEGMQFIIRSWSTKLFID